MKVSTFMKCLKLIKLQPWSEINMLTKYRCCSIAWWWSVHSVIFVPGGRTPQCSVLSDNPQNTIF